MFSLSNNSSVVTETLGYLPLCLYSTAGWCEMENFTIQKSRQGFILYFLYSFPLSFCFLFATVVVQRSISAPLFTESLTALVWDKADIFILPSSPTLLHKAHHSSGRHSLNEETCMLCCVHTLTDTEKLINFLFPNVCTAVCMTDRRSRKLILEL